MAGITLGGAVSTTTLIDLSSSAGLIQKAKMEALMADPVHMKLIENNVDDHPEFNIMLLQMHKIRADINLIRSYFDDIEGEIDKKLTKVAESDTPLSALQAKAIAVNSEKPEWTGLKTDWGPSTSTLEHIYDKDTKKNYIAITVEQPTSAKASKKYQGRITLS